MLRAFLSLIGVALVLLPGHSSGQTNPPSAAENPFCVVGYLPDYRLAAFRPEQTRWLTDLIYFSIEPDASGNLRRRTEALRDIRSLRQHKLKEGLRLLVCVGGWERSGEFPRIAANESLRAHFIEELTRFCADAGIHGVDLDWEHPATEAAMRDYARLIVELERAFTPHKLLVTVALANWQTLPPDAVQAVQRIHSMAYDAEGDHASLAVAKAAVARLRQAGVPSRKICLGVPFYGRNRQPPRDAVTYADIVRKHQPALETDEVAGLCFNGVNTVRLKTEWARAEHLGGVMVWELGQDAEGDRSLLRAIHDTARK